MQQKTKQTVHTIVPFTMPQVQRQAEVIAEDTQTLRKMVADAVIYEAIGYATPDLIMDNKLHRKSLLNLLDKIHTAATELRWAAFIAHQHSKIALKSKVEQK